MIRAALIFLLLTGCSSMPSRIMSDMTADELRAELAKPIGAGQ